MSQDYLLVNQIKYPIRIYLENRMNSRVSIVKTGINIRLPRSMREADIEKQILIYKDWAKKKLQTMKTLITRNKNYKDGDKLILGKKEYTLSINKTNNVNHSSSIIKNKIILKLAKNNKVDVSIIKRLLSRAVAADWRPWLENRIHELNKKYFNMPINKIRIKYNKTNWGSCSSRSNINISTRIFFAPPKVIDYVLIHELTHLIEHNHSKKFWKIVSDIVPDYKIKNKWLKDNFLQCDF